jgi:ATP-dependent DNA helicase RecG
LSGESSGLSREALLGELPVWLQREVQQLGQRSRDTRRLNEALVNLCAQRPFIARELGVLTGRNPAYLQQSYLNQLLREGRLRLRHPEDPNRPDQAYMTPETRD